MTSTLGPYETYKRDIGPFVYWVLQQSNAVVRSLPLSNTIVHQVSLDKPQIAPESLVSHCKLIGKLLVSKEDIPKPVTALLQSVMDELAAPYATFQRLATNKSHPDVKNGSASLNALLTALRDCALALHCWELILHPDTLSDYLSSSLPFTKEKLDGMVIKEFSPLNLPDAPEASQDSEQATPQEFGHRVGHQRKQAKPGKGKRARRRKEGETSKAKAKDTEKGPPVDVFVESMKEPLESFGVTLGQDGMKIDYIMAVYELFEKCFELRAYLQEVWYEVAYEGLNIAVAGALSNMAILQVQRSEERLLAGFPEDKKTYHSVMGIMSSVFGFDAEAEGSEANKGEDAKEMFLVHTYHDLLDFLTDYRKSENGRPTKGMMKEVKHWKHDFDLRHAATEERLKWRRLYTIRWLYHLVDQCTLGMMAVASVCHKNIPDRKKAEEAQKEARRRKMLGIHEFAAFIKYLTYEKSDIGIREMIHPHHVFQLQCIVDSLAVTKGWTFDLLKGHVLIEPPHADKFSPMRDVNYFLLNIGDKQAGFLKGFLDLKDKLTAESAGRPATDNYAQIQAILKSACDIYCQFVGEGPNFLWNCSPFLCGVSLVEALDFQLTSMMHVWGQHREPVILMHLYNMLLREGYLDKRIDLFESLQLMFLNGVFAGGKMFALGYAGGLTHHVKLLDYFADIQNNNKAMWRAPTGSGISYCPTNPHGSFLVRLRDKAWNCFDISEGGLPLDAFRARLSIAQAKQVHDHNTGKKSLEGTGLVKMARAALPAEGLTEDLAEKRLLDLADGLRELLLTERQRPQASDGRPVQNDTICLSTSEWFDVAKVDIQADVEGDRPFCGLNYAKLTCHVLDIFRDIEKELHASGSETYSVMYGDDGEYYKKFPTRSGARFILFATALTRRDEKLLQIAAKTLAKSARLLSEYLFWDKLKFGGTGRSSSPETDSDDDDDIETDATSCTMPLEEEVVHMDECVVVKGVALDDGTVLVRKT
ncbi:hypothetical protein B0T09DRAFT_329655 [Sordaria sp. MPI-SDFR-AT-0083]|nr:hypothetical protein B0T09DRAFT_329655 [Sordaria sp. MPI-SDFR-AT-0083]